MYEKKSPIRKPVKIGNNLAIVLDEDLLKNLGIERDTPLKISTDGRQIVIEKPANVAERRAWQNQWAKDIIHEVMEEYAPALKKLAKY